MPPEIFESYNLEIRNLRVHANFSKCLVFLNIMLFRDSSVQQESNHMIVHALYTVLSRTWGPEDMHFCCGIRSLGPQSMRFIAISEAWDPQNKDFDCHIRSLGPQIMHFYCRIRSLGSFSMHLYCRITSFCMPACNARAIFLNMAPRRRT